MVKTGERQTVVIDGKRIERVIHGGVIFYWVNYLGKKIVVRFSVNGEWVGWTRKRPIELLE